MNFTGLKPWLAGRMPARQQLAAVYGMVILLIYGWTLYWFAWKLPSWLYFLTMGEIAVSFCYAMSVNFFESLLVLSVPLLVGLVLPPRWFRDRFVALGTSLVIMVFLSVQTYLGKVSVLQDIPPHMRLYTALDILGMAVILFIIARIKLLGRVFEEVANRAVIFVYVFLPISAVSLLVVLIRNIVEAFHA